MADNKLSLNVLKTDFIIVGPRSKMRDLEETLCTTIQNETIYRAPLVNSLGFFIDENLDWGDHVSHVLKKVSSGLSILKMSKNYLPQGTLKILYNSLIETHFRHGNIIWGNCGDTFLARLQKLQNRAARIITGSDYDTPAEPLIEQLRWKTVREWIQNDTSMICPLCSSMQPHQYLLAIRKWLHPLSKSESCKINLQKILRTSFSGWRITSCH